MGIAAAGGADRRRRRRSACWLAEVLSIHSRATSIEAAQKANLFPLLLFAITVLIPISEESLFRGFLFRGWLQSPRSAWPVIVLTAGLFAIIHVQYDWFLIGQVFAFGVLFGWMRWVTGSTLLTMLLHGLVNLEGMIETLLTASR